MTVLDRRCARLAEERVGQYLGEQLGQPVTVRLRSRPFLAQAVRGVYREIELSGVLQLGAITGATFVATLTGVRLPVRDLVRRRVTEVPCERVAGRIVLPYAQLAELTRIPGLGLRFDGRRLVATLALPSAALPLALPALGQLARVSGDAQLTVRDGALWLGIRGVSVAGIALPSQLLGQLLGQLLPSLDAPIPLPPLPYGLRLEEVQPTASGLVVEGSADGVVFRGGVNGRLG